MAMINVKKSSSLLTISFCFGVFLFCPALFAGVQPLVEETEEKVSEGKSHAELILLTVDKKTLQASLHAWPEKHEKALNLRQFKIAIGKELGDKMVEGDNRTPEGIYFTQQIIDGATLPAKYGPRAIPINFPNPMDRLNRKTGYGIWLHGVENNSRVEEANVTEGCVAFYNEDIMQLAYWLKPFQGVVLIADNIEEANRPEDLDSLRKATYDWIDAWSERDMDRYISHYDQNFTDAGRDRQAYKTYKSNVFRSYREMHVKMADIRVIAHPSYAISMMNQDFRGDKRFVSNGRKILYWTRDQETQEWRIIREVFENRRIDLVEYTPEQLAMLNGTPKNIRSSIETHAEPELINPKM